MSDIASAIIRFYIASLRVLRAVFTTHYRVVRRDFR